MYKRCLELGDCQLFSFAPVTAVVRGGAGLWDVVTPRGVIKAKQVVHATNAYSKLLLPELDGLVTPFRGTWLASFILSTMMAYFTAQAVRLNAPGFALAPTMSLRRSLEHFYSVYALLSSQTTDDSAPQPDGSIVLSCSRSWAGQSAEEYDSLFDTMDDSAAPRVQALDTVGHVAEAIPGADAGGIESHWSGIIAWVRS